MLLASRTTPPVSLNTIDIGATHIPLLVKYALQTTGAILELGSGDYSTPLLSRSHTLNTELS